MPLLQIALELLRAVIRAIPTAPNSLHGSTVDFLQAAASLLAGIGNLLRDWSPEAITNNPRTWGILTGCFGAPPTPENLEGLSADISSTITHFNQGGSLSNLPSALRPAARVIESSMD